MGRRLWEDRNRGWGGGGGADGWEADGQKWGGGCGKTRGLGRGGLMVGRDGQNWGWSLVVGRSGRGRPRPQRLDIRRFTIWADSAEASLDMFWVQQNVRPVERYNRLYVYMYQFGLGNGGTELNEK